MYGDRFSKYEVYSYSWRSILHIIETKRSTYDLKTGVLFAVPHKYCGWKVVRLETCSLCVCAIHFCTLVMCLEYDAMNPVIYWRLEELFGCSGAWCVSAVTCCRLAELFGGIVWKLKAANMGTVRNLTVPKLIKKLSCISPFTEVVGRDSSVSIVTAYDLDGRVFESRWGRQFPHQPILAMGSAQPL